MKVAPIFCSHMVLQRNKPIRIWGEGQGKITVTFKNQAQTTYSKDGKWEVALKPEIAGGPYELRINSENEEIILCDVMVGDVWLAAGQSNMECVTFLAQDGVADAKILGKNDNIRFFTVPRRTKKDEEVYRWHFESVLSLDKGWEMSSYESALRFSAIGFWFADLLQKAEQVPVGIINCNFGGTRVETWIEYDRVMSEPKLLYAKKEYEDAIQNLDFDCYMTERKEKLSKVEEFCKKYDAFEMSQQMGLEKFAIDPGLSWPEPAPIGPYHENFAGVLFENMIKPIAPIGLAGVLWYQGESNARNAEHYCDAFSLMVENWRDSFKDELPFLTVQIAPYDNYCDNNRRMVLNQQQMLATQKNKKVYLVGTGDIGEAYNIHPLNKKKVAERLFLAAQSTVYGKTVEYCGPVARTAEYKNSQIVVSFDHAKSGLNICESVNDVQVCDEQGEFSDAHAYVNGDKLYVDCDGVSKPKTVRMGCKNYSETNLFNLEGLPAMPFCIDVFWEDLQC